MPEPAIHSSVVFAVSAPWLGVKRALALAALAIVPDLDVLFHVHRSATHSAPLVILAYAPVLAAAYRWGRLRDASLGLLAILSHLLMDCFQTYTPLLYPIVDKSIWLKFSLSVVVASPLPALRFSLGVEEMPLSFNRFQTLDAPLFTSEGFAISALLFAIPLLASLGRGREGRRR